MLFSQRVSSASMRRVCVPLEPERPDIMELLPHKLHSRRMGNDSRFMTHIQQTAYGFTAVGSVVESTLVHVHANKLVGQSGIEVAGELHSVGKGLVAMIQSVLNAFAQSCGNSSHELVAEATTDGISSEGQRQPGYFLPPSSQINDALQARLCITQLAFVDDEPGFLLALQNLWNDLVEGHHVSLYSRCKEPEDEICRG